MGPEKFFWLKKDLGSKKHFGSEKILIRFLVYSIIVDFGGVLVLAVVLLVVVVTGVKQSQLLV